MTIIYHLSNVPGFHELLYMPALGELENASKIYAINVPMMIDEKPDSADSNNVIISNPITQRRCSPAVAPLKLAPLRMALVKFAPLISALLKLESVRF